MRNELINEYFFYDRVRPEAMDHVWQTGWRHFGRYFYRYSLIPHNGGVAHVLPLRIALDRFKLSRSQKRVLKRNADLSVRFRPAFVSNEVFDLFERHKTRFKDNVPDSVYTFISQQPDTVPCECLAVTLYDGERLIGISYLDVGKTAMSSVYQCFDPDESKRSLGILLVLLSAQYAADTGKTHYYPGYAYQESSHYDYKKAFFGLEAYNWQLSSWLPLERQISYGSQSL